VRTFVVEDFDEIIEAGLLLKKVGNGGFGRFFFQGEMHAFMAAVLMRMTGLDAFNADAQAEPPHRELAQMEQGVSGSEGYAFITADVGGQAAVFKKPLKHCESVVFLYPASTANANPSSKFGTNFV
jgi:hypothetical protein